MSDFEHLDGCGYSGIDPVTGIGVCAYGCPIGGGFARCPACGSERRALGCVRCGANLRPGRVDNAGKLHRGPVALLVRG